MSKWIFSVVTGFVLASSLSSSGFARSTSFEDDAVVQDVSTIGKVKGKVSFERRATIVPLGDVQGGQESQMMCENAICAKSEPYWVLVILQDKVKYELQEMFNLGSESPPESVLVSGAIIRPGTQITLEGRIQLIAPGYATIRDIRRIDVEMD